MTQILGQPVNFRLKFDGSFSGTNGSFSDLTEYWFNQPIECPVNAVADNSAVDRWVLQQIACELNGTATQRVSALEGDARCSPSCAAPQAVSAPLGAHHQGLQTRIRTLAQLACPSPG